MAHKSLYIFLSALLGALLFLILHRVIVFIFLYLVAIGTININLNYREFLAVEYFTLILVLMMGVWYGIWLGVSWFNRVYEEKTHGGFFNHLSTKVFSDNNEKLKEMLAIAKERLAQDAEQVGEIADAISEEPQQSRPVIIEETIISPTIIEPPALEPQKKSARGGLSLGGKKVVRKKAPKKKTVVGV